MYCIVFRVSVCFGFGIVCAGCLHDLPAGGNINTNILWVTMVFGLMAWWHLAPLTSEYVFKVWHLAPLTPGI